MILFFRIILMLLPVLLPCLSTEVSNDPKASIKRVNEQKTHFLKYLNDPNKSCTLEFRENESREKVFKLNFLTKENPENINSLRQGSVEFTSQDSEEIYMLLGMLQIEILPTIEISKWKAYQQAITDFKNNKALFNFNPDSPIFPRKIHHPARLSRSNRESHKTGMEVARRNSLPANVNSSVSKPKK